jgi:para-aminobenzoate synthetase component 1
MNRLGKAGRPFLFAVNFELTQGFIIPDPLDQEEVFFEIHGQGNKKPSGPLPPNPVLEVSPLTLEEYTPRFQTVMAGLKRGDSYLVNLTVATPINRALGMEAIFGASAAPYQLYVPEDFVCFSPERFVLIQNGRISSCPMKGTINAAIPGAAEIILNDFKETAEHATIVDLLRNDLSLSAKEVRVSRYRYIEKIKTKQREILQVSSEITGVLGQDYRARLGDIIFKTLPAGSCSGAPKESTLRIIRRAEKGPRGYYTGVFGVFDGETLDSGVLIRFIEKVDGQFFFRSGGGITAYSDLKSEWREVLEKIYLPFV